MNKKMEKVRADDFKLPRYLKLAKGTMFLDTEGDDASGVRLYATKDIFIGRPVEFSDNRNDAGFLIAKATDIPKDRNQNKSIDDFGKIDNNLPWFVDTSKIDNTKLSRIITAYKYGILVEADPEITPDYKQAPIDQKRDFEVRENGDRIFTGKNKEMFTKLQNMSFKDLRGFVESFPETQKARDNLMDLYTYELRGYNSLNRPRVEVLNMIKKKLQKFGPGISAIRVNED
jgi:hypothetical protein